MSYLICPRCEQAMRPGGSCDGALWYQDGREIAPIPYGAEGLSPEPDNCPDCFVGKGSDHHYHCAIEQCPHGNQGLSCDECPVLDHDPYHDQLNRRLS